MSPLFDYTCELCSLTEEKITKGQPTVICPACKCDMHKHKVNKGTNFSLQGMHWHNPGFSH